MSDIRKAIMARLGEFARPGVKAEMAASVRRGIDPKKGGQWINGTWDGGTWSAMVFSEPSEAYGIPEFPHISKLAINPKDKPGIGGVIVNYDRGWDIKPSTPELQKAYREIAQIATAEVNKAVKQGWYSRHGEKEKMANTSSQEVRSRLLQLQGEISNLETKLRSAAKAGDFRLCHGICRVLTATYEKLGAAYLQWDAASKPTTASRPGAKAEMGIEKSTDVKNIGNVDQDGYSYGADRVIGRDGDVRFRSYFVDKSKGIGNREISPLFASAEQAKSWIKNKLDKWTRTHLFPKRNASRPGAKAEMANHIRTVAEDKEASRRGLRRMIDQLESEWQSLNNQPSKAGRIPRMETIKKQIAGLEERLKSLSSRPGAKAKMGRWEESHAEGWGDLSKTLTATINGTRWTIVVDASTGKGQLMRSTGRGPQVVKEGAVDQLKRYAETARASRPGEKSTNALSDACWKGYEAVGTKKQDGKTVPNCVPKATAAKPAETPAMRELGRKMQELTQKADRLLRQSLSASVTSEQSQQMQDEVERISEQLDAMGEDLARQRKAAGFEKPSDLEREDVKAGLKLMEKADEKVSEKIRTLIKEGKPQDQAVAIALDMKRRGEL